MYVCCDLYLDSFATQISQILADLLIVVSFVYIYTTIYVGCNCVWSHWHADFTDSCRCTAYDNLYIMTLLYVGCDCVWSHWHADFTKSCRLTIEACC